MKLFLAYLAAGLVDWLDGLLHVAVIYPLKGTLKALWLLPSWLWNEVTLQLVTGGGDEQAKARQRAFLRAFRRRWLGTPK